MKISITLQKGTEIKKAVITFNQPSNAPYIFWRFYQTGWLVIEAKAVP